MVRDKVTYLWPSQDLSQTDGHPFLYVQKVYPEFILLLL